MEDLQKYFESHKDKRDFPGHTSKVHSVAWSCEGKWLASGSLDKTVGVFHLERNKLVSTWWSRDVCHSCTQMGSQPLRKMRVRVPSVLIVF